MKTNNVAANAQIDHLVVAADSLSEGLRWCQSTLGITPEPGGAHALFGTHNRLVRLRSATHPLAYLEIIAIDPSVRPTRDRSLARWFDLDVPSIRQKLQQDGPQLVHWVARVPNITVAVAAWHALGIDRGQIIETSRPTPRGLLRWKITAVRRRAANADRMGRRASGPLNGRARTWPPVAAPPASSGATTTDRPSRYWTRHATDHNRFARVIC